MKEIIVHIQISCASHKSFCKQLALCSSKMKHAQILYLTNTMNIT